MKYRTLDPGHRMELLVAELMSCLPSINPVESNEEARAHLSEQGIAFGDDDDLMVFVVHSPGGDKPIFAINKSDHEFWQIEVRKVLAAATERAIRSDEIVIQQSDIQSYLTLPVRMGSATHPWTMAFIAAVNEVATRVAIRLKCAVDFPRPIDLSADVVPIIQTPAHSAVPNAHAMEAHSIATVIGGLYEPIDTRSGEIAEQVADRIQLNRVIGGVHFEIDGLIGKSLGQLIGTSCLSSLLKKTHSFNLDFLMAGQRISNDENSDDGNQSVQMAMDASHGNNTPVLDWLSQEIQLEIHGQSDEG